MSRKDFDAPSLRSKKPNYLLFAQKLVELGNQHIAVNAVNHAGLLEAFRLGSGASEAVHSCLHQHGSDNVTLLKKRTDCHVFGNHHFCILTFLLYLSKLGDRRRRNNHLIMLVIIGTGAPGGTDGIPILRQDIGYLEKVVLVFFRSFD